MTYIVLAIYILGVWMTYNQLQRWSGLKVEEDDEYQTLFSLSMLSWIVFPVYGCIWLYKKIKEG